MGAHVDVPGMGILGGSDFSEGDMVLAAIEEADERHAAFEAEQEGSGAPLPLVAQGPSRAPMPSAPSAVPDPVGSPATGGPSIPGGRPPGYAVGTQLGSGSASAAAGSLLASLGAAAGAGYYFKDPKAAAAGFLVTGSALNLYHGQSAAKNPNPAVAQEGTWSTVAAAIGLGLGCYLAYGVYKGSK